MLDVHIAENVFTLRHELDLYIFSKIGKYPIVVAELNIPSVTFGAGARHVMVAFLIDALPSVFKFQHEAFTSYLEGYLKVKVALWQEQPYFVRGYMREILSDAQLDSFLKELNNMLLHLDVFD